MLRLTFFSFENHLNQSTFLTKLMLTRYAVGMTHKSDPYGIHIPKLEIEGIFILHNFKQALQHKATVMRCTEI